MMQSIDYMRRLQITPGFRPSSKRYAPVEIPTLDPEDFHVFDISQEGTIKVNGKKMVNFMKVCRLMATRTGLPYRFNGVYYQSITDQDVLDFIVETSNRQPESTMLTRSQKSDIMSEWISTAKLEAVDMPDNFLEDGRYQGWLIPFENGIYNVERDELVPFSPFAVSTFMIHADYMPMSYHPVEEIYRKIIPDDATRDLFFTFLGYTLYSEELTPPAVVVLLGPGETGKSALLRVIRCLMGDETVADLNPYELSESFALDCIIGKRALLCSEGGARANLHADGNRIKQMAMGEEIYINRKFLGRIPFTNTAKMWFAANRMPDFGEIDDGVVRRIHVIPCREKQDPKERIYDILCAPDALAYAAFRGLKAYVSFLLSGESEFVDTPVMIPYKKDFRESDPITEFLTSRFGEELSKDELGECLLGIGVTDLYQDCVAYYMGSGRPFKSSRNDFKMAILLDYGLTTKKKDIYSMGKRTSTMVFAKKEGAQ